MSNFDQDIPEDRRRKYEKPYTGKKTIPTISKYRAEQEARQEKARAYEGGNAQDHLNEEDQKKYQQDVRPHADDRLEEDGTDGQQQQEQSQQSQQGQLNENEAPQDTSEASPGAMDPKQRRKQNKKKGDEAAERQVTDPVTHLPVTISDYTNEALEQVQENQDSYGSSNRTATGQDNKSKSSNDLEEELGHLRKERAAMQALFPPPDFNAVKTELTDIHKLGVTVISVGTVAAVVLVIGIERLLDLKVFRESGWLVSSTRWLVLAAVAGGAVLALVMGVRDWVTKKIESVWDEEVWEANRQEGFKNENNRTTESVQWLNSLLSAVWPLVNPDLFTSIADMLEDVMQASLPKFVRMVSVEDIGQGSESVQILGVKWLPTGAAARSVTEDGDLRQGDDEHPNDQKPGSANEINHENKEKSETNGDENDDGQQEDGAQQPVAEGLEGEEGDFVNMEVAFAYRARTNTKLMKERSKDAHLYLAFFLPGGVKVPVWVELRGIVGSMRMRLQLCPDPPFFSMCTLTMLGQPKVDISCVPLSKYAMNLMDVPLISNFVQSSVDAAVAEYVAPKSLNLDLKDMLAGDDFKKDTAAHGVLVVNIKHGYDFKTGDTGIPLIKNGSSDPYVSVGWAKFGKPVWSTRLLMNEMEPYWEETCYVLVTSQELNVDERLRVQLWDSDRMSADDDLGRIEVNLKELMHNEKSNQQMWDRTDGFRALEGDESMPGKLEWRVGYFRKPGIQQDQLEKQSFDPDIRSMDQLKESVDKICERKLREANVKEGRHSRDAEELDQQKAQELKEREDAMIISAPPPDGFPSGVFSIQVHQITGLELAKLSKSGSSKDAEASDEEEDGDGLPSAYCTVIINHKKTFKTRTKPTNSKPFYNAGTERYIGDWRSAEVHISVRDARVKEEDPLLGIVRLPLAEVFKDRSQVNGFYPLVGGVGYGRVRVSMVWRSINWKAPPAALGWDHGTLEIGPTVTSNGLGQDLSGLKMKFRTYMDKGKMYANKEQGGWATKNQQSSLKLGVQMRYSSCLSIAFEDKSMFGDKVPAFAVFWLKDISDEERQSITLPVWKGDFDRAVKNNLPECGEKVGEITVQMTFWSGLGAAHEKWAKKDRNVRNVVEVLDTARDHYQETRREEAAGITAQSDSDDSGSDGEESNDESDNESGGAALSPSGVRQRMSEFKERQEKLGRKHRGIMQWRLPRTAKWGTGKMADVEDKFKGIFTHHTKERGIETEA